MVNLPEIIEKFPAITPRESDSIIFRFIEAFQDDADEFGDDLDDILESRFIDSATGSDLDRIGKMYGPLGTRAGRDDDEYRKYLKSLVPVFQYRGTVPGIKEAVAAGLDIESGINGDSAAPAELEVYEHFNDDPANPEEYLEYTIILEEWPEHRGSTVEELAELSDASASRLRKTRYDIEPDEAGVIDDVNITLGEVIAEAMASNDANAINANLTTVGEDTLIDDSILVNPNLETIDEASEFDDAAQSYEIEDARWDQQRVDWDFFEWAVIEELARTLTDSAFVTDANAVNPNLTTVAGGNTTSNDTSFVNPNLTTVSDVSAGSDAASVDPNLTTAGDDASADDAVFVDGNTITSAEDSGMTEAVATDVTVVTWEGGTWNEMTWTKAHN